MNPWIVLPAIVAVALFYVLLPVALTTYSRYRQLRFFRCPETREETWVLFDAGRAMLSSCFGRPRLLVRSCALWPLGAECARACGRLPEAEMRDARELTAA
jgi:hypothetical protein